MSVTLIMASLIGDVAPAEKTEKKDPNPILFKGKIQEPDTKNGADNLSKAIGRMQKDILDKQAQGEKFNPEIIDFAKRPTENVVATLRNEGYIKTRGSFDNVRPGDELRLLKDGSLILTTSGNGAASYPIYNVNKPNAPKREKGDSFSSEPTDAPKPSFVPPKRNPYKIDSDGVEFDGPTKEELDGGAPIARMDIGIRQ